MAGMGPGDRQLVLPVVWELLQEAEFVAGGERNLSLAEEYLAGRQVMVIKNNLAAVAAAVDKLRHRLRVLVLASGDPGLYGIVGYLRRRFRPEDFQVVPGISAVQLAFARLRMPWQDAVVLSAHGRDDSVWLSRLHRGDKFVLFLDGGRDVGEILSLIKRSGFCGRGWLMVSLGYPEEKVIPFSLGEECLPEGVYGNALLVLLREGGGSLFPWVTPGLPDQVFVRGEVPMTKEEVRTVILAKLRLLPHHTVWDVGAGTGSISVEVARLLSGGRVFAVEREEEGVKLIKANREKFHLSVIEVVAGEAPAALQGLPAPDRVVVGGSGGRLQEILTFVDGVLKPGGRIVVPALTLETVQDTAVFFREKGYEWEMVQLTVARGRQVGGRMLLMGLNPVFVISGEKKAMTEEN